MRTIGVALASAVGAPGAILAWRVSETWTPTHTMTALLLGGACAIIGGSAFALVVANRVLHDTARDIARQRAPLAGAIAGDRDQIRAARELNGLLRELDERRAPTLPPISVFDGEARTTYDAATD